MFRRRNKKKPLRIPHRKNKWRMKIYNVIMRVAAEIDAILNLGY